MAQDPLRADLRCLRRPASPFQEWNTSLKNHVNDSWACYLLLAIHLFFPTLLVFFMIELGSRRVVHFGVTRHPADACVAQP